MDTVEAVSEVAAEVLVVVVPTVEVAAASAAAVVVSAAAMAAADAEVMVGPLVDTTPTILPQRHPTHLPISQLRGLTQAKLFSYEM